MVETFDCTDNGTSIWEFDFPGTPPKGDIPTYQVTMARHAVGFGPAAEVVDTIAAGAFFVPPSPCDVYGWNSQTTNTPVWHYNVPNCDASLLYDEERVIAVSDDGTTAVFSAFIPDGQTSTPALFALDAQTGALLFQTGAADAGTGAGTVSVSVGGSFITWNTQLGLKVYGRDGALRDTVASQGPVEASESGAFIGSCTENSAKVFAWDGSSGSYLLNQTFTPPASPASDTWFCVDVALSSDGSGQEDTELVSYAWISGDVLTARVITCACLRVPTPPPPPHTHTRNFVPSLSLPPHLHTDSLVTGKVVIDWTSQTNSKLQTNPTIRMDGNYVGVALWGDQDDTPTAVVLSTAAGATPVFTYTTPGSMFGVDLVVDHSACTPTNDVIYFAVAGKHTPANVMGNGGDAFAWRIDVAL